MRSFLADDQPKIMLTGPGVNVKKNCTGKDIIYSVFYLQEFKVTLLTQAHPTMKPYLNSELLEFQLHFALCWLYMNNMSLGCSVEMLMTTSLVPRLSGT